MNDRDVVLVSLEPPTVLSQVYVLLLIYELKPDNTQLNALVLKGTCQYIRAKYRTVAKDRTKQQGHSERMQLRLVFSNISIFSPYILPHSL